MQPFGRWWTTRRRLNELRGKVVLVNLWATWCPTCRKEMLEIDKLQKDYADRGLIVVTLRAWVGEKTTRACGASHPGMWCDVQG